MESYNINPEYNIDIGLLKHKLDALKISSTQDNIYASELLGEIDRVRDTVAGRCDAIIDEYQKRIDETKSEYAPVLKELDAMKKEVKQKMLEYKLTAQRRIREIKEGISSGRIERTELFVDEQGNIINESALSIRTDEGLSSVRKYFVIQVTDFAQVPDDLKKFDKKAALAMAKKGIKNIPGLAIEERRAIQYRNKEVA